MTPTLPTSIKAAAAKITRRAHAIDRLAELMSETDPTFHEMVELVASAIERDAREIVEAIRRDGPRDPP